MRTTCCQVRRHHLQVDPAFLIVLIKSPEVAKSKRLSIRIHSGRLVYEPRKPGRKHRNVIGTFDEASGQAVMILRYGLRHLSVKTNCDRDEDAKNDQNHTENNTNHKEDARRAANSEVAEYESGKRSEQGPGNEISDCSQNYLDSFEALVSEAGDKNSKQRIRFLLRSKQRQQ